MRHIWRIMDSTFALFQQLADAQNAYQANYANEQNRVNSQTATREATRTAGLAEADASAEESSAMDLAAANRETASRTGQLAMQLASARRTPGGGIRQGINRRGFSAGMAGFGLNKANAEGMKTRRKATNRARVESRYAQTSIAPQRFEAAPSLPSGMLVGGPIGTQYY